MSVIVQTINLTKRYGKLVALNNLHLNIEEGECFGYIGPNQRGRLGALEGSDALKGFIKQNDWNQFHVVARGNLLVHVLNGHVTALFLDDDPAGRAMKGLIGLQIHVGNPMKAEFRNIWLKTL